MFNQYGMFKIKAKFEIHLFEIIHLLGLMLNVKIEQPSESYQDILAREEIDQL